MQINTAYCKQKPTHCYFSVIIIFEFIILKLYFNFHCEVYTYRNIDLFFRVGDYILSINSTELTGLPDHKVQQILRLLPRGLAKLVVSVTPPDITKLGKLSPFLSGTGQFICNYNTQQGRYY